MAIRPTDFVAATSASAVGVAHTLIHEISWIALTLAPLTASTDGSGFRARQIVDDLDRLVREIQRAVLDGHGLGRDPHEHARCVLRVNLARLDDEWVAELALRHDEMNANRVIEAADLVAGAIINLDTVVLPD